MNVPIVNTQGMRIVINVLPTPDPEQYGFQTLKEGMDDKGWGFVHRILTHALHQVALQWVEAEKPPSFLVPPLPGVRQ